MELFQLITKRLENYRDYSNFEMKKYKEKKPSKLNFKVIDGNIRIKLKKDVWILVEGDKIFLVDTYFPTKDGYVKAKKEFLVQFGGRYGKFSLVDSCIGWINKFINKPELTTSALASRYDPLVCANMYAEREDGSRVFVRVSNKRCNMIRASQINEARSQGVVVETGATINNSELPSMKLSSNKKAQKFTRKAYADNSKPSLVQGLRAR